MPDLRERHQPLGVLLSVVRHATPRTRWHMTEQSCTATDSENTVTLRVWYGRKRLGDSPDETYTLELHDGRKFDAPTVTLSDSIRNRGWMAFDLTDLPDRLDVATIHVHADDSYHEPEPLAEPAVERGLAFDGDYLPGEEPPCYLLNGRVEVWAEPGVRFS